MEVRDQFLSFMDAYSKEAADAIVLMSVIRQHVLADGLPAAHDRGVRQLVILGAGLDTTAFAWPAWAAEWRLFEVDHPATQQWKRQQITKVGWHTPSNLVFTPCDFETQDLLSALDAAGFNRTSQTTVSLFGVIVYLTPDATRATLAQLATLARGSEVLITYCPPPDGTDAAAQETFDKASPRFDTAGESFLGYYRESEIERLVREAGFQDVIHHPNESLNARYLTHRTEGLRLHPIEQLLTAIC